MNNPTRLLIPLSALERFVNYALSLKHDPGYLNGFHFDRELFKATVASAYLETVDERFVQYVSPSNSIRSMIQ
jgi:hypothetical protein